MHTNTHRSLRCAEEPALGADCTEPICDAHHQHTQELEDARKSLLSEQTAQLAHLEETRQAAQIERTAHAKKYQVGWRAPFSSQVVML